VTFNTRITWRIVPQAAIYLAVDNLADARVAESERGNGIYMYDQPRAIRGGLTVTFGQ
jgi:outer membrane receptor protein involved in Fe transport